MRKFFESFDEVTGIVRKKQMLVIKKAIAARHLQVKFNTIVIAEMKIKEVYRKLELQLPWDSASPSSPSSSPPPTGCCPSTSSTSSKESNLHPS